jgi:phosphonate transport system substrate-binding protein
MDMKKQFFGVAWLFLITCSAITGAEEYSPSGAAPIETTYIFAPHPYLNPQDLFNAYDPLVHYLERKIPGVKFIVETSRDYADYENKITARHFHFGLPNPYQTLFSLEHGYHVIAKMKPDEDFRGLMVVRKDRKVSSPHDLEGQTICFPSPTAVAATMLPMLYLYDHGLDVKQNIQIKYVGSQISSIMNAYTGDAAACGTTVRYWRTWSRDNPDKAKELETLWQTNSLPHNGVIARDDVSPNLAQKVAEALIGMEKDMELDQSQFKIDQAHFEAGDNDTYQPMAIFLKHYDKSIGLPGQMKSQSR